MAGKPGLVIAFGGPKKPAEGADAESGDAGDDVALEAKKAALQDMFAAAKAGDWERAAMAFKDAYEACAGHKESSEEEY